ncbi:MAG: hypothetical protein CL609_21425 [Anaerolineaceae bacterium]|nr:hypothetical protein [Anaerolineaceae bacterium]
MENQNPEPNKNEEEYDDLDSMRSKMSDREDAPNAEEENGGLIKNIGKIFTRKLPPVESKEVNGDRLPDSEDEEPNRKAPFLETNETKTLPELDNEDSFNLEPDDKKSEKNPTSSLIDFFKDKSAEDKINAEFDPTGFSQSPTIPRNAFQSDPLEETPVNDSVDPSKTKPLPDINNEDFMEKVTASLRDDIDELGDFDDIPKPKEIFLMDDLMVKDIENEIDHANEASNPFESYDENESDDDFISRLEEMFPEQETQNTTRTKPLSLEDEYTEFFDDENSLSREKWEQVFKATEETTTSAPDKQQLLNAGSPINKETPTFEDMMSAEDQLNNLDLSELPIDEITSEPANKIEEEENLNTLRQSFIEEFEQSPWTTENEDTEENKSWFAKKWMGFKNWIQTLSTAEKILMFLSVIISITVLVAISMVAFEWNLNRDRNATPPETLEVMSDMEIYPTGLQLPGGWFFFLKQGQIQQSGSIGKWEPEGAEWLAGTTIRRVVAIPWSKQAEAVVLSLENGDEIRLFLNNNEVNSFYVEEIKTVEYDNVRDTMIDTQPSLAVILYRDDKADRLVIIARPK